MRSHLFIALAVLAACTSVATAQPSPTPSATASAVTKLDPILDLSLDEATEAVRRRATAIDPLLLPSWVADGMRADVTVRSDGFSMFFHDPGDKRVIRFAVLVRGSLKPGDHGTQTEVRFRTDPRAFYQVTDARDSASERILLWLEPMGRPSAYWVSACSCIPYDLSSQGLSESEFWRFANSLR